MIVWTNEMLCGMSTTKRQKEKEKIYSRRI